MTSTSDSTRKSKLIESDPDVFVCLAAGTRTAIRSPREPRFPTPGDNPLVLSLIP